MKEYEINQRVRSKIETSNLEPTLKKLLSIIIKFEISEGKYGSRYTKFYQDNIDSAYIRMKADSR